MSRPPALVLAGHGSQRHPNSSAPLEAHADRIRSSGPFDEVQTAFWKEEPTLRGFAETLRSPAAVVVPILTSEGYFANEVFPRELGVDAPESRAVDVDLAYADPVGTHAAMVDVIVDRVESARTGPPGSVAVALVGHGTERNARSARATRTHAGRLRDRERYARVEPLFLDEEPAVADLTDHVDAAEVVVVPFFVADGHHTTRDVPDAFGHPGIGETADVGGRIVHYTGAVGTEPALADVIVERAEEALAERGWSDDAAAESPGTDAPDALGPGPASGADEAFLDWVDAGTGSREWGQLSIRADPNGFELRHRADDGRARSSLTALDDPATLRDHVRHDDRGRYRPLSGAQTLPTGWVLAGVDGEAFVRAVEFVYPDSVARWHRERRGRLSTTPFEDTVDRQTGFYADLDDLDSSALEAVADAVCGDCVRDRQWSTGEETERGGEGDTAEGDEPIPCAEACPFFLSAAHAFRDVDPEAAADVDPTVPPGDLEAPGNRYRVRFAEALAGQTRERRDPVPTAGGGD